MTKHHLAARSRPPLVAAMTALLCALLTMLGVATATAAPPYETEADVTDLQFVQETVESGESAQLSGNWSLPDNPTAPAGFTVPFPDGMEGNGSTFNLFTPDGEVMGSCIANATELVCDFDDTYIAENPRDLHGAFTFWATVTREVTEETEHTFEFDEIDATVTITPNENDPCTEDCGFAHSNAYKHGDYHAEYDEISWSIRVGADENGMAGGLDVVVTDNPGPGHTLMPEHTTLRRTNETGPAWDGRQAPVNYEDAPEDSYTVSADGSTVSFTSEEGYFYRVHVRTTITDGGAQESYYNAATIEIEGQETIEVDHNTRYEGGSGTGIGTDVGMFSLTKELTGDAVGLEETVFTGTYEVYAEESGEPEEHTFEVQAGDTWESPEFPADSRVVILGEDEPVGPGQVQWAQPVFSETDFVLEGGTMLEVTLTNEATVPVGQFSAVKAITGDGAAQVPDDAVFTVNYSYPAGPGFEAGSGEMVLPADGTAVTSPQIPAGAVVTVTEQEPAAVEGAEWGNVTYSAESLTITAGAVTDVTVTNEITATPPPPEPEEPTEPQPEEPTEPELPTTGADGVMLAGIAGMLLLAGTAVLVVRRRSVLLADMPISL